MAVMQPSEGAPRAVPQQSEGAAPQVLAEVQRTGRFNRLRRHPVVVGAAAMALAGGVGAGVALEVGSSAAAAPIHQGAQAPGHSRVEQPQAQPAETYQLVSDPCNVVQASAFQALGKGEIAPPPMHVDFPACSTAYPSASGVLVEHAWKYVTNAGATHLIFAAAQYDEAASGFTSDDYDNAAENDIYPAVQMGWHLGGYVEQKNFFENVDPITLTTPSGRHFPAEVLVNPLSVGDAKVQSMMIQANVGTPSALDIVVTDAASSNHKGGFADFHDPAEQAMAGAIVDQWLTPLAPSSPTGQ